MKYSHRLTTSLLLPILVLGALFLTLQQTAAAEGIVQARLADGAVTCQVNIEGVSDLYGASFSFTFDPDAAPVTDVDPDTPGTQFEVGPVLTDQEHFVARNWVDSDTNTVEFAATLRDPAVPFEGDGTLASLDFEGGQPDPANLTWDLSDKNGETVTATEVYVDCSSPVVSGRVLLEDRINHADPDHSDSFVCLINEPCSSYPLVASLENVPIPDLPHAFTDGDGYFDIDPFGGPYSYLCTFHHGYLVGQYGPDQYGAGQSSVAGDVGTIELKGGDVTEDDHINIFDLALIASCYARDSGDAGWSRCQPADVNQDGKVDVFDLSISANNYNQSGPLTDWYE